MSDPEAVLTTLRRVDRRVRLNRVLRALALGLPAMLVPLLGFGVAQRFLEIPHAAFFLGLWIATCLAAMLSKILGRRSLARAASLADARGDLKDELTTAYWFIRAKTDSAWVTLQIERAARTAHRLDPRALVPTVVPRGSLLTTTALSILTTLFWVWPQGEGAPVTSSALAEWLEKAPALDETEARALEKTLAAVEAGKVSLAEGLKELDEMQNLLEEGNLDAQKLREGLDEMADEIEGGETLDALARALRERRLDEAAELLRKLAQNAKALEKAREGFERAGESGSIPLESLLENLKKALEAMEANNRAEADRALRQAARNLEEMGEKLDSQERMNEASRQLRDLRQALARDLKLDPTQAGLQMNNLQKRSGPAFEGGAVTLPGEAADGEKQAESQDSLDGSSSGLAAGRSQSGADAPGEPTRLDVQLEMEKIEAPEKPPDPEKDDISKEKSREERSAVEYEQVSERPSYASEDALHAERIPWEYRTRVKSYFLTLQPRSEKQKP